MNIYNSFSSEEPIKKNKSRISKKDTLLERIQRIKENKIKRRGGNVYQARNVTSKLLNQDILKLQKIVTKNFNILLVGCTNAGKSTLINEFLKLEGEERAG